jgi:hypothetical protein
MDPLSQPAKCETVSLLTPVEAESAAADQSATPSPRQPFTPAAPQTRMLIGAFAQATPTTAASAIYGIGRRVESVRS